MSDMKIRPVKVQLDKERNILFDLNAFEELEEIYGTLSIAFKAFSEDEKKIKHIKNFLYASLKWEDETLTPKLIGTLISYGNIAKITDKLWESIGTGMPEAKEVSEDDSGE